MAQYFTFITCLGVIWALARGGTVGVGLEQGFHRSDRLRDVYAELNAGSEGS